MKDSDVPNIPNEKSIIGIIKFSLHYISMFNWMKIFHEKAL